MRILQVHKYFSRKKVGGAVTAIFEMIKMLEDRGNKMMVFSMKDKHDNPSEYSKYFTKHFDLNERHGFFKKISLGLKIIYNFEAIRKIKGLIKNEKPQVAHFHNIYHYLSLSIVSPLRKNKIPIVMTLHDYKVVCPNYKFYTKGEICEKCKGRKFYYCFLNKCIKDSFVSSFVIMAEAYVHRFLRTYEKIDLFTSPSYFLKNKCVEFGIPTEKIRVVRNLVNMEDNLVEGDYAEGNYILYFGRISKEKGILDLIKAVEKIRKDGKLGSNKLLIVGQGPEEKLLKKYVGANKLGEVVDFIGLKTGSDLKDIIRQSKAVVIPSIWYENASMVIVESQLAGKAVIVSDLGGSKELIVRDKSGLIFEAGNISELSDKIKEVLSLSFKERKKMGEAGKEYIKDEFNEERLYNQLMGIYQDLINKNRK